MEDSALSQNRLDDLIHTISEAKRSLNNWQDKRTEALIRLDSFTYDIQMLNEEKKRNADALQALQHEIQNQSKVYQNHIAEITDAMQLLKFENETLRNEAIDKDFRIESMATELENQRLIREQQVKLNVERLSEIRLESNYKTAQMIETEMRAERLEREIVQIRSNHLNVRDATPVGAIGSTKAEPLPLTPSQALVNSFSSDSSRKPTRATDISIQEIKRLRAVEIEPDSVEDYLKRLGY